MVAAFKIFFKILFWFIFLQQERKREVGGQREGSINVFFHLFMHSLVASCVCLDQGWNPQPWHIRKTL